MSHNETVIVTGSKGLIAQSLIKELSHSKNVIQWEENINKLYKLDRKVDTVYHLAAAVGRKNNILKQHEIYDSNVLGTMHVINFCKSAGANCIFTSTAGVYEPTKENIRILTEKINTLSKDFVREDYSNESDEERIKRIRVGIL